MIDVLSIFFKIIPLVVGLILGVTIASPSFESIFGKVGNSIIKDLHKTIYSLTFMALLMPLSLFVITSTGSTLGSGIVVGICLKISLTLYKIHSDYQAIATKIFNQLQRNPTKKEIKFFVWLWWGWTAFCLVLLANLFFKLI